MNIKEYKKWRLLIKKRSSLKLAASTGIFKNKDGDILFVKPIYKPKLFQLPGGFCEKKEDPESALKREVLEELSINIETKPKLMGVSHINDILIFVYDCGELTDDLISKIKLDKEEIEDYKFIEKESWLESGVHPLVIERIDNYEQC